MIAPLPKRRSIWLSACSMAFSRSLVAVDTKVALRSAMDFSFLLVAILHNYRVQDTGRVSNVPLTTPVFLLLLFFAQTLQGEGNFQSPRSGKKYRIYAPFHLPFTSLILL